MNEVLSFYSKDFSICFNLQMDGQLRGVFITNERSPVQHDFVGLYARKRHGKITLSFLINWNLRTKKLRSYSAFSGTISGSDNGKALQMKWLMVLEKRSGYPKSVKSLNACVLKSIPLNIPHINQHPFPDLEIAKVDEFTEFSLF